jgi:hypothetical protein
MRAAMRKFIFLLLALCPPAWAQNAPFFDAVAAGSLADVARLLGAGADVNARTEDAETPLYVAAEAMPRW